jgi:hypothetical protein
MTHIRVNKFLLVNNALLVGRSNQFDCRLVWVATDNLFGRALLLIALQLFVGLFVPDVVIREAHLIDPLFFAQNHHQAISGVYIGQGVVRCLPGWL